MNFMKNKITKLLFVALILVLCCGNKSSSKENYMSELNEKIRDYFNWDNIFESEIEYIRSRDYCLNLNTEFILNGDQIVDVNRY